jgi:hypothetical protein
VAGAGLQVFLERQGFAVIFETNDRDNPRPGSFTIAASA